MPRWQQQQQQYGRRGGSGGACAQCGADDAQLTADKAGGAAYCDDCWAQWAAARRQRGGAGADRRAAAQPPEPPAEIDAPGPPSSSSTSAPAAPGRADASGDDVQAQPLAAEQELPQGALARFAAEVAELRRLFSEEGCEVGAEEAEEQQQMEIESLEAIYGEALQVLSQGGERPLTFRLEFQAEIEGRASEIFVTTPEGQAPAGSVEELPPLLLYCALPPRYPLDPAAQPRFALEAEHLCAGEVEALERALGDLAEQRAGEPLLFEWSSTLQERFVQPRRVVLPDTGDAMGIALRLLAHSRHERERRRSRESHECPVCFDEVLGSRGIFLACGHFGCRPCLEHMALLHASESDIGALKCPVVACREPFDFEVLRELLASNPEALKKWEDESLRRCLDRMQDVVFCPRCDADGDGERVPVIEDEDHMARCGVCLYVFCGRCKGVYHPDAPCPSADDRLDALEAKASGAGPEAKAARAELMTLRHLARTTKNCPNCSMGIEKSEGCSKVLCGNCKVHFCWRCNKVIDGYDHFATSDCRLFDDEEIRRWNQQVNKVDKAQVRAHEARFLAQFIDPAKFAEQFRQCPRCRAAVLREGKNNHLRCFSCQTHFCARCWEVLPSNRPGDHFQKLKRCPQHSDD